MQQLESNAGTGEANIMIKPNIRVKNGICDYLLLEKFIQV